MVALSVLPSCRKPRDAMKSDLIEAGYQMTPEEWLRAAAQNDVPALRKFVAAGFDSRSVNAAGDSALHAAAGSGAMEAADYLLERGIPIDLTGAGGRTPLMSAVLGDQSVMVRWLLRQGADPRLKADDQFSPLMLAVREGKAGPAGELAPYHRESLDVALLLAAVEGRTEVIDTLTNYGASVYARMEDGRTPLMLAAENGHKESVELLIDIGASRFSTDAQGRNAVELAESAGHPEIAGIITQGVSPQDLALGGPEEIALEMDAFVNAERSEAQLEGVEDPAAIPSGTHPAAGESASGPAVAGVSSGTPPPSRPIDGETLSAVAARPASGSAASHGRAAAPTRPSNTSEEAVAAGDSPAGPAIPPLVMRHYRQSELPVEVRRVENESAVLAIQDGSRGEIEVRAGEKIPGSRLVVVRVDRRMRDSKDNLGQATEVSVVEVRDETTGATREWISGVPASAHDPVALVEDAATGRRYTAAPGQRFRSADGRSFVVSDVRPNQMVIEDSASGEVTTIPLSGPRG
jgi:ankyrin repeat protein